MYIIGITGSVASGKSTIATQMAKELNCKVVSTDSFLYTNSELTMRNLQDRKGFPESYDVAALREFLTKLADGLPQKVPVYSHKSFDILPDVMTEYENCEQLILEGVGIGLVRDLISRLIFLDVDLGVAYKWYKLRYEKMINCSRTDPDSYFHQFVDLNPEVIEEFGRDTWININEKNYFKNILPLKDSADEVWTIDDQHIVLNKEFF
ncbi:MAG: dephospho-CoA kinase [Candidatus Ancillula sp.]|jgi:type I pantothenate kinase|nr:dephospho-CoA kinase [Candidatus Ancillula sp.]